MTLETRHLAYVDALARAGTFSRAAEELGITQPTLSRAIQGLEDRVGGRLFDRLPKGVVPTALGNAFVTRARPILSATSDLERELAAIQGLETGHLRVLVGPYVAATLLGAALGRFLERAPGVRVEVDEADSGRLPGLLLEDGIHVAVAEISLFTDRERLAVEPLGVRQGEYVCRAGHPLLGRHELKLADVIRYPLATTQIPPEVWERLAGGSSLSGHHEALAASGSAVRCQSLTALADLVESSDAIGIFSRGIVRRRLHEGTLAVLPLDGPRPTSNWGILHRKDRTLSPAASAFIEAVRWADAEVPLD